MAPLQLGRTLGDLIALPVTLTRSALMVPGMVNSAAKILEDIAGIVESTEEMLATMNSTLTRIQRTADAASALPRRVAHVIEQSEQLPGRAVVVIQQASGVFDGAGNLLTEADGLSNRLKPLVEALATLDPGVANQLTRLKPLLEALADLDPGVASQLGRLVPTIGPLLSRLEDEVIPSVASLQSLVPVVELLHLNVGELQAVVTEVGKLIGNVPGASLLRRRADREPGNGREV